MPFVACLVRIRFDCISAALQVCLRVHGCMLAQKRDRRFSRIIMAISHDDSSLGAIAENSAAAFGAWVHEKLGRSDVVVSCVRPAVG